MPSLFDRLARFARTPQGQRAIRQAQQRGQELARDPRTRAKVDQIRSRFLNRRPR